MMAVRCCCQPKKVLGYLPKAEGRAAVFYLRSAAGHEIQTIVLPIAIMQHGDGTRELAYKADGVSVEQLHRIPRFVEIA